MSATLHRVWVIARHETRVLRRDSASVLAVTVLPVLALAFVTPATEPLAQRRFGGEASGAEIAAPAVAVIFVMVLVGVSGWNVYQERVWRTWDRVRLTPARPVELLVGILLPTLVLLALQLALVFLASAVLFDLRVRGSTVALVLVCAAFAIAAAATGLAVVAWARTVQEVNTFTHLGALAMAGLGGALTPLDLLPGWVGAVAPCLPSYWAVKGFHAVIVEGAGLADVAGRVGALLAFALAFGAVGLAGFRSARWRG